MSEPETIQMYENERRSRLGLSSRIGHLEKRIESLEKDNTRLIEALTWYAKRHSTMDYVRDSGLRAKEALTHV